MTTKNSGGVDVIPSNLSDYVTPINKAFNDLTGLVRDYRDVALPSGSGDYTLLLTDLAPEGRSPVIRLTATLTANRNVLLPSTGGGRVFIVWNDTAGAFTVTVKTDAVGSTGFVIPQGSVQLVFHNGTNVYPASRALTSAGSPAVASAYHSANQALANGVWTTLALNSEDVDTATMHDLVTNNSRIVIPYAGIFVGSLQVVFAASALGAMRGGRAIINGSVTAIAGVEQVPPVNGAYTVVSVRFSPRSYAKGDYVEAQGFQDSGAPLNALADAANGYYCKLSISAV